MTKYCMAELYIQIIDAMKCGIDYADMILKIKKSKKNKEFKND